MTSEQQNVAGGSGGHQHGRGHGLGRGLVSGLATTARALVRHTHTAEYPDVRPDLPPRSRGVIALLAENCTSCMLCARECPDWCIYIESHKEEVPAAETGGRARQKNMLDRFAIDFSLCMYCGICIEVCPFDALFWSPEFEYAEFDIRDLLHESDRLESWMTSVQPPPLPDPRAVEAKEVGVARAAAEKAIAAYEAARQEAEAQLVEPHVGATAVDEATLREEGAASDGNFGAQETAPLPALTDETQPLPPAVDETQPLPPGAGLTEPTKPDPAAQATPDPATPDPDHPDDPDDPPRRSGP